MGRSGLFIHSRCWGAVAAPLLRRQGGRGLCVTVATGWQNHPTVLAQRIHQPGLKQGDALGVIGPAEQPGHVLLHLLGEALGAYHPRGRRLHRSLISVPIKGGKDVLRQGHGAGLVVQLVPGAVDEKGRPVDADNHYPGARKGRFRMPLFHHRVHPLRVGLPRPLLVRVVPVADKEHIADWVDGGLDDSLDARAQQRIVGLVGRVIHFHPRRTKVDHIVDVVVY